MKRLFFYLLLLLSINSKSQTITGVTPNQGTAGTTLNALVTGTNTFFLTASAQGYINMSITLPGTCSQLTGTSIIVISQDSAMVHFVIPANFLNGSYDLHVSTYSYGISLPGGITIVGGVSYGLQSITPDTATQNSVLHATITGANLQSVINSGGYTLRLLTHLNHIYPPTNIQTVNANTITADFVIDAYCDTGFMSLSLYIPGGYCFTLNNAVHILGIYPKRLVSISPSQGTAGTTLSAIVTGQNTYFIGASPQGFQMIQLNDQHCHTIVGTNPSPIDNDHLSLDFDIPSNAVNGTYDLFIRLDNGFILSLLNAVTITGGLDRDLVSISPSSITAGSILHATITGLGVDSIFAFANITIVSSSGFALHPTNIITSPTIATMDIPVPIYASNGLYSIRVFGSGGCYTVPDSILVSGGIPQQLISISPSSGVRGQTLSAVLTGTSTFFLTGSMQGNIIRVEFESVTDTSHFIVFPPNITVTDSNHATIVISIPFAVTPGYYDVNVYTIGGPVYSLLHGFEVIDTNSTLVGIIPDSEGDLLIYPNPASERINILVRNPGLREQEIRIFNIDGKLVRHLVTNNEKIDEDVGNLSSGLYYVIVNADGEIVGKSKLIISK